MSESVYLDPYYDSDKLGLDSFLLDADDSDPYGFDMLVFWADRDGRIYSASDAGCSCPSPFEEYRGRTWEEIAFKLERIGSVEQAERIFDSWNAEGYERVVPKVPIAKRHELSAWVANKLGSAR